MSAMGEATLYGDLIRYLRERWAREVAGDDTDLAAQTERINRLIKSWLFEPQDVILYGYTPRDYIRYEQTFGIGPSVERGAMRKIMAEHSDIVKEQGYENEPEDGLVHFNLACRVTLLDEYDAGFSPDALTAPTRPAVPPEMAAMLDWMAMMGQPRPRPHLPEASHWLRTKGHTQPFAPHRFPGVAAAQMFVDQLYHLGAASVEIDSWEHNDNPRATRSPCLNALRVALPAGREAVDLYQLWVTELALKQELDLADFIEERTVVFFWK